MNRTLLACLALGALGGIASATPTQVSTGLDTTCEIDAGALYCWGDNSSGQIGDGTNTNRTTPTAVTGMSSGVTAVAVAVDGTTVCAIQFGALYCWGDNTYGQVGDGSTGGTYDTPTAVGGLLSGATNVTAVSTSVDHTCAIAGAIPYCWGDNSVGQLGDNKLWNVVVPTFNVPFYGSATYPTISIAVAGGLTCEVQHDRNGSSYYNLGCWGLNNRGRLGELGTTEVDYPAYAAIAGSASQIVTAVTAGPDHVCALAGPFGFKPYCWGNNDNGEVGDGTSGSVNERDTPTAVTSFTLATAITAGGAHTCAATATASACWGAGSSYQLDTSTTIDTQATPLTLPPMHLPATSISAGDQTTCFIRSSDVVCVGSDGLGGTVAGPTLSCGDGYIDVAGETCDDGNTTPGDGCDSSCTVQTGYSCAGTPSLCTANCGNGVLDAGETCDDGNTTSADGCSSSCQVESNYACSGTPSVCAIICGNGFLDVGETCDDGNTSSGDGCSSSCQVESSYSCSGTPSVCALICGNGVLDAGETCDDGNTSSGDGCSSTCQVEASYSCSGTPSVCALICGNGVLDAGETCDDGNTSSGDGCSSTCQIENGYSCAGAPSSCALTCGNGVLDLGEACDDHNHTSGDGCSASCQIEPGYFCTGTPSSCLFSTAPPTTPITISSGLYNTCKISAAGALYCWGDNSNGQIDGTFLNASTPIAISGMSSGVTDVSVAGDGYTICAVKSGSLYCWGDNATGQIGDGTTEDKAVPTRISSLVGVQRVAAAGNHTCALVLSTTLVSELDEYCWGDNTYGQLGLGTNGGTHNSPTLVKSGGVRDIAAHRNHTCDVSSGSIYCWGRNDWGQLGLGNLTDTNARGNAAMTGGVQVASGWNHVCGITSAGVAKCWGANDDGQVGIGDCGSYAPCVGGHPYFTTAQTVAGVLFSSIVAGGSVSCGVVTGSSTTQCWGYGGHGQMGAGQASPSCEYTTGAIHGRGGTLNEVCNNSRPRIVASQNPASRVAVGAFHIAVTLTTTPVVVHSWGDDNVGQIGDGGGTRKYSPVTTTTPSGGW